MLIRVATSSSFARKLEQASDSRRTLFWQLMNQLALDLLARRRKDRLLSVTTGFASSGSAYVKALVQIDRNELRITITAARLRGRTWKVYAGELTAVAETVLSQSKLIADGTFVGLQHISGQPIGSPLDLAGLAAVGGDVTPERSRDRRNRRGDEQDHAERIEESRALLQWLGANAWSDVTTVEITLAALSDSLIEAIDRWKGARAELLWGLASKAMHQAMSLRAVGPPVAGFLHKTEIGQSWLETLVQWDRAQLLVTITRVWLGGGDGWHPDGGERQSLDHLVRLSEAHELLHGNRAYLRHVLGQPLSTPDRKNWLECWRTGGTSEAAALAGSFIPTHQMQRANIRRKIAGINRRAIAARAFMHGETTDRRRSRLRYAIKGSLAAMAIFIVLDSEREEMRVFISFSRQHDHYERSFARWLSALCLTLRQDAESGLELGHDLATVSGTHNNKSPRIRMPWTFRGDNGGATETKRRRCGTHLILFDLLGHQSSKRSSIKEPAFRELDCISHSAGVDFCDATDLSTDYVRHFTLTAFASWIPGTSGRGLVSPDPVDRSRIPRSSARLRIDAGPAGAPASVRETSLTSVLDPWALQTQREGVAQPAQLYC